MTPEATDYAEAIKKKVADQLAHLLLPKDKKPERVRLVVDYPGSEIKIDIDLND